MPVEAFDLQKYADDLTTHLDVANFINTGGTGGGGSTGGPTYTGPSAGGSGSGGNAPTSTVVGIGKGVASIAAQVGSSVSTATNLISCIMSPGSCLLRLVILIIGLICIAGAIYLYKPTSEVIAAPVRAVRKSVTDAALAAGE